MNKAPHARCEACPLRDQPIVPPDWPNRSERFTLGDADHGGLAIVGEAPGAYEVAKGRPFVGRSGDLLNKHLARFGIDRRDVWMTNAVLCRPPDNKLSEYHKAVECCRPRLIAELRALKPEVVLAMGNTAKEALLPEVTEGITAVRGRDYYSEEIGARVRPTLHPAYVLRYPPADLDLRADIETVFQAPPQRPAPTEFTVIETQDMMVQLANVLDRVPPRTRITCDLETSALRPDQGYILCIQLSWKPGKAVIIPGELLKYQMVRAQLRRIFVMNESLVWYGHNFSFDYRWLKHHGIQPPAQWSDTMLMHGTLDETKGGHGLKDIAAKELNAEDWDAPLKALQRRLAKERRIKIRDVSYAEFPRDVLYKYAARDTDMNLQIIEPIEQAMDEDGRRAYATVIQPAQPVLADVQEYGWQIDQERLAALKLEYYAKRIAMVRYLNQLSDGVVRNPNSWQQKAEYMYRVMGWPVHHYSDGGNPSTDDESIEFLLGMYPDNKFLRLLREYQSLNKIIGTYLEGIEADMDDMGRVHPDFDQMGTVTGRLAAGLYLTIPRETKNKYAAPIRSLFVPRSPNRVIVGADYSQAEIRVMAVEAREEVWKGIFEEGRDIHGEMATYLFGPEWGPEDRMIAKMFTFGLAYGRGPDSIAEQQGWPKEKARAFHARYMDAIPAVKAWQEDIRRRVHAEGILTSPFGRKRRFPLITPENRYRVENEALNFIPQSTASDLTLLTLVHAHNDPQWRGRAHGLLMMHDGVYFEVDRSLEIEFMEYIGQLMEWVPRHYYSDYVRFEVDVKSGPSWGELHG